MLYDNNGVLCEGLCQPLRDSMQRKSVFQPVPTNERNQLHTFIEEQDSIFEQTDNQMKLQNINITKHPDLWLARTGWSKYLENFNALHINSASMEFDDNSLGKRCESAMIESLLHMERTVRDIGPNNKVLFTIKCRPHQPWPDSPYVLPTSTSGRY